MAEHREEELRARRSAQLAGDGNLAAKLRRDEARLCLNISKMEERLQRLAPDPGLVEEVERLAVERTVREADVILSCLSSPLERYLHPASCPRPVSSFTLLLRLHRHRVCEFRGLGRLSVACRQ